jgi:hypothetical protein
VTCDFPRAWEIASATPVAGHDLCCSYRVTIGAMLCDCPVLTGHPEYADEVLHGRGGAVRTVG